MITVGVAKRPQLLGGELKRRIILTILKRLRPYADDLTMVVDLTPLAVYCSVCLPSRCRRMTRDKTGTELTLRFALIHQGVSEIEVRSQGPVFKILIRGVEGRIRDEIEQLLVLGDYWLDPWRKGRLAFIGGGTKG